MIILLNSEKHCFVIYIKSFVFVADQGAGGKWYIHFVLFIVTLFSKVSQLHVLTANQKAG
jgi:hypothetical protein